VWSSTSSSWSAVSASVKASPNAPDSTQGYDGGKRIKGRKRHIATDVLGLLLVFIVTAAGVQDTNGGKLVRDSRPC
jgi:hypothetical protein